MATIGRKGTLLALPIFEFNYDDDNMSEVTDDNSYKQPDEEFDLNLSENYASLALSGPFQNDLRNVPATFAGSPLNTNRADQSRNFNMLPIRKGATLNEIAKARIIGVKVEANRTAGRKESVNKVSKQMTDSVPPQSSAEKCANKISKQITDAIPPQNAAEEIVDATPLLPLGETQRADVVARRIMEKFVEEMKEFGREGGFLGASEGERRAFNDLLEEKYLGHLVSLPDTPIVRKVRDIISNFINGRCRPLESFIQDQIKDEIPRDFIVWVCAVCGRKNKEWKKKIQRLCVTCGRDKGYAGSKKIQRLNAARIDVTPLTTTASKEELMKFKVLETRKRWEGEEAKKLMFLSSKDDYEVLARTEIKNEIDNVLATMRSFDEKLGRSNTKT